jgi:four helix bundle protein
MKIQRFEDLECWQEARTLVNMVYRAINDSSNFQKDFRLVGQITGAAISVMNNIVEGWASQSNGEFVRFLTYSRRSAAETQNCAYLALDQNYITKDESEALYEQALKSIKVVDGLLRYLRMTKSNSTSRPKVPVKSH